VQSWVLHKLSFSDELAVSAKHFTAGNLFANQIITIKFHK